MDGAKQTIWHQSYIRALETITSLRNHCDFVFEKDAKNAKEVKILNDGTWNPEDGYGLEFKKSYPENNIQTVTIEDKAGNQNTVEVVINNIDKEAPELVIDTIVDGVSNTENP